MTSTADPAAPLDDGSDDEDGSAGREREPDVASGLRAEPDTVEGGRRHGRGGGGGRWVLRWAVRGALALALAGVIYLGVTFAQVWDASRSDDARPSQAIIVLGAAQYDCEPSPVLRSRLDHALELYTDGIAPRIVVTGGRQAGDRCTEASASADYLIAQGVPDADILREVQGRNSWESIAASANFLADDGLTEVVLVTDGYHALRVKAIADELGLDPVVSPVGEGASARDLFEETGVVAVGRIVGFRRLVDIDERLVSSGSS